MKKIFLIVIITFLVCDVYSFSNHYVTKDTSGIKEEIINFRNGENYFEGTLTFPDKEGKYPAIVMITGSGAQDRDENVMGFKIFKIISEYLSRNGYAVLRYDDRNTGKSRGISVDESTTDDFATDVIEAVKYLETREDIDNTKIGLFGHSEGGIVAPLAATRYDKISFIILMAGTGVTGKEIILEQTKLILQADSTSKEVIDFNLKQLENLITEIQKNTEKELIIERLKNEILNNFEIAFSEKDRKDIVDKEKYVDYLVKTQVETFNSKWMKYFLSYNPALALEKVTCPVLMLFGGKDLQVSVKQNEKPMIEALKKAGNKNYDVKTFDNANHLFQEAKTGSPSEYISLKKEFVSGFLEYILNWLNKITNK